jgi:anti-anti-sigma regulatory factor
MMVPTLTAQPDPRRHALVVTVQGPLATYDHGVALTDACLPLPPAYHLLVNLSGVTIVTDTGVHALRQLVHDVKAAGSRVAFVCSELILRAELMLADLDLIAPVVEAEEHAYPFVGFAA